jgi:hypothetical protein
MRLKKCHATMLMEDEERRNVLESRMISQSRAARVMEYNTMNHKSSPVDVVVDGADFPSRMERGIWKKDQYMH